MHIIVGHQRFSNYSISHALFGGILQLIDGRFSQYNIPGNEPGLMYLYSMLITLVCFALCFRYIWVQVVNSASFSDILLVDWCYSVKLCID